MKHIILIRHAKVDIENYTAIHSSALKHWVKTYDMADIHSESLPENMTKEMVKNASVVLTSALKRTIDSAKVLGVEADENNVLFNEAKIPDVKIPFLKLKPKRWLIVLRVLLLFGFGKKDASLKASKAQAAKATQRLLTLSLVHDKVVLVGHGGMNWLIRKQLVKKGWKLEGRPSNRNWGTTMFTLK